MLSGLLNDSGALSKTVFAIFLTALGGVPSARGAVLSQVYDNSKIIPASCDTVWPAMLSVMTQNRFTAVASDRAGGIFQAQHGAISKYRGAKNDMNALTLNRSNFWTAPEAFQIVSGGVIVVSKSNGCLMTVQIQYAALKTNLSESIANAVDNALTCRFCPSRPLAKNWVLLQSNGKLESMIIAETEHLLDRAPSVPQPVEKAAQMAPIAAERTPFEPVRPQESAQATIERKPWEVSADSGIADNNGSVCHLTYRVKIKNNTREEIVFSAVVAFLSADGSTIDSAQIAGLRVAAGSDKEISGSKMMASDDALKVVKTNAELTVR